MKKIFAFAIALVAMATSMVSCNNDNADFIEQKAPTQENTPVNFNFDGDIYFCAYESQFQYINTVYDVQVGDETIQVNVENLQVTKELPSRLESSFVDLEINSAFIHKDFVRPNVYVYHIPANMKGEIKVTYNWSAKENIDPTATIDVFCGAATNIKANVNGNSFKAEYLDKQLNIVNGKTVISTTLK